MKKVMVYAYTRYNLGDDLLVKILCDRYRDTKFVMYTYPLYSKILTCCNNLSIYSNSAPFSKIVNCIGKIIGKTNAYERSVAHKCDLCICITGSLFIQGGVHWEPYLHYIASRRLEGKPYFLLGANFGPYSDPLFFQGFKELFKSYTDICFREKFSYELFSDLENVRFAPDVVLSGDYSKYVNDQFEKRVACSVIDFSDRVDLMQYKENYLSTLEMICKKYLNEGYTVDLLSFCSSEGDELTIDKLEDKIKSQRLIHHRYCTDTTLEGMLDCIGKAEIVIASRFHAMILGWSMKKKTLPIIYSSKMRNVMDDFGYTGMSYDIIHDDFFDVDQMDPSIFDITKFSEDSYMQFKRLDEYLKKEDI